MNGWQILPATDLGNNPGIADEFLLEHARQQPVACVWQGPQGLVVPRTYTHKAGFDAQAQRLAQLGWPLKVRQSGGGVVPQGQGIVNLSLATRFDGQAMRHAEGFYLYLCELIAQTLLGFGIHTNTQEVKGSWCDGRFNLAVGSPARKVVGTAQMWRHLPGQTKASQIGLAHAVILVHCDPDTITAAANLLEQALGQGQRYDRNKVASLHLLVAKALQDEFATLFKRALLGRLAASQLPELTGK